MRSILISAVISVLTLMVGTSSASAEAHAFTPYKIGVSIASDSLVIYVRESIANVHSSCGTSTTFRISLAQDDLAHRTLVNIITTAVVSGRRLWIEYPAGATCTSGLVNGATWFVMLDS
jgi:hypothetical protein